MLECTAVLPVSIPYRQAARRIGNAAIRPCRCMCAFHLIGGQREVEHVEVLRDAFPDYRARDGRNVALLDESAQHGRREGPFLKADTVS